VRNKTTDFTSVVKSVVSCYLRFFASAFTAALRGRRLGGSLLPLLRLRLHGPLLLLLLPRSGLRSLLLLWLRPWLFNSRRGRRGRSGRSRSRWSRSRRTLNSRSGSLDPLRWSLFNSRSRTFDSRRGTRYAFRLRSLLLLPHRTFSPWR
jgi:hypothetical protein